MDPDEFRELQRRGDTVGSGSYESWGICRHCGAHTERDEDPAPELCYVCAKAGRMIREAQQRGRQA